MSKPYVHGHRRAQQCDSFNRQHNPLMHLSYVPPQHSSSKQLHGCMCSATGNSSSCHVSVHAVSNALSECNYQQTLHSCCMSSGLLQSKMAQPVTPAGAYQTGLLEYPVALCSSNMTQP
eukprot:GHRR01022379.1.p1 GENE.GHRR01022379.1~~GHRR01022379.1.p1  ORF type:complete len:119 (-),score=30.07 GHRR01022379.1:1576-1932(-)